MASFAPKQINPLPSPNLGLKRREICYFNERIDLETLRKLSADKWVFSLIFKKKEKSSQFEIVMFFEKVMKEANFDVFGEVFQNLDIFESP